MPKSTIQKRLYGSVSAKSYQTLVGVGTSASGAGSAPTSPTGGSFVAVGGGQNYARLDGTHPTYAFWVGDENPANAEVLLTRDGKLKASTLETTGVLRFTDQTAAPVTPSNGYGYLYPKSGKIYWMDDNGTEYDLTSVTANDYFYTPGESSDASLISGADMAWYSGVFGVGETARIDGTTGAAKFGDGAYTYTGQRLSVAYTPAAASASNLYAIAANFDQAKSNSVNSAGMQLYTTTTNADLVSGQNYGVNTLASLSSMLVTRSSRKVVVAYGVKNDNYHLGTGDVGTFYCIYSGLAKWPNTGKVDAAYGNYVNVETANTTSDEKRYGFYQYGTATQNVFFGQVGIGILPTRKLSVFGGETDGVPVEVSCNHASVAFIDINSTSNLTQIGYRVGYNGTIKWSWGVDQGSLDRWNLSTGGQISINTKLSVTTDGKVGVDTGAFTPQAKLQVGSGATPGTGEATYKGVVQICGAAALGATGGLEFKTSALNSGCGWKVTTPDLGSSSTPLVFGSRTNNAVWTERVRFDDVNGYVGIGGYAPTAMLDVTATSGNAIAVSDVSRNQRFLVLSDGTTQFRATGDTSARFSISYSDPKYILYWGAGGTSTLDTNLYRNAADNLKTDDKFTANQLEAGVATGTAPIVVNSTTLVEKLNVEYLNGLPASAFARAMHTHDLMALITQASGLYFRLAGETADAKMYSGAALKWYNDVGGTVKASVTGSSGNIYTAGNIGVGVDTPENTLHIRAGDGYGITFDRKSTTDNNASEILFKYNSSAAWVGKIRAVKRAGGGGDLQFATSSTGSVPVVRLALTRDGYAGVGNGCDTSQVKWLVGDSMMTPGTGEAAYKGAMQICGAAALNAVGGIELKASESGYGSGWKITDIFDTRSILVIGSRANNTTWTERMRIDSQYGYVGIGNTAPVSLLTVGDTMTEIAGSALWVAKKFTDLDNHYGSTFYVDQAARNSGYETTCVNIVAMDTHTILTSDSLCATNVQVYNTSAAINYLYGIRVENTTTYGMVGTSYGLYLTDSSGATNAYGIYQSGVNAINVFEGCVRAQGPVNQNALNVDRVDIGVEGGTPRMVFENYNSGSSTRWMIDNDLGTFRWFIPGVVLLSLAQSSNYGVLGVHGNGSELIRLNTNGASYLNGGDIGIGATSPGNALHIRTTNGKGLTLDRVGYDEDYTSDIRFKYYSNSYWVGKISAVKRSGGGGDLQFYTSNGGGEPTTAIMTLGQTGNATINGRTIMSKTITSYDDSYTTNVSITHRSTHTTGTLSRLKGQVVTVENGTGITNYLQGIDVTLSNASSTKPSFASAITITSVPEATTASYGIMLSGLATTGNSYGIYQDSTGVQNYLGGNLTVNQALTVGSGTSYYTGKQVNTAYSSADTSGDVYAVTTNVTRSSGHSANVVGERITVMATHTTGTIPGLYGQYIHVENHGSGSPVTVSNVDVMMGLAIEMTSRVGGDYVSRVADIYGIQLSMATNVASGGTAYGLYQSGSNVTNYLDGVLRISGDYLGNDQSGICFTGTSNTSTSSGVGTVKMCGATSRNSSGFIKIYIGANAYYIPVFSVITS